MTKKAVHNLAFSLVAASYHIQFHRHYHGAIIALQTADQAKPEFVTSRILHGAQALSFDIVRLVSLHW